MRIFIHLAAVFLLSLPGYGTRPGYLIEGKIKNLQDSCIVSLFRLNGDAGVLVGRDTIVDGVFRFEGVADTVPVKLDLMGDNAPLYGNLSFRTGNNRTRITGRSACIPT